MAKPSLGRWPVSLEIPVLWGDMDAFGYVSHTQYMRWFETARIAYFDRVGVVARLRAEGVGPILARSTVDYRRPLSYPDKVRVHTTVTRLGKTSFTMCCRLLSAALGGAEAAFGEGVLVMIDYRKGGKVPLDLELRKRIYTLEEQGA